MFSLVAGLSAHRFFCQNINIMDPALHPSNCAFNQVPPEAYSWLVKIVHLDLMYVPKQFKWFVALEVAYKFLPCLLLISNMLVILIKTNMYTQSVAT
jgi:hypothetical protein